MQPIPDMRTQAEAEAAALGQMRHWRTQGLSLAEAADAIGSNASTWDELVIDAMRAYRDLFVRQNQMVAQLEAEAATWQR